MPEPNSPAGAGWRLRLPDRQRLMLAALLLACLVVTAALVPLALGLARGEPPPRYIGDDALTRLAALVACVLSLYLMTALYAAGRVGAAGWLPVLVAVSVPFALEPGAFAPGNVPQAIWVPYVLALAVSRWPQVLLTLVLTLVATLAQHPQAFATPGTIGVALVIVALLTAARLMREQLLVESASARQLHGDAVRALGDAEATVRALFEGLGDAVVLTDPQRRIRAVNQGFEQMFGYRAGEVLGRSTALLFADPEDYERVGRRRHARMLQGLPNQHEARYRRKDGSEFWAEASGRRIQAADGRTIGAIGLHRDISERRRAEEAQRKSLKQMERFVREAPNQIAMFDREMRYIACSPRWLGERGGGRTARMPRPCRAIRRRPTRTAGTAPTAAPCGCAGRWCPGSTATTRSAASCWSPRTSRSRCCSAKRCATSRPGWRPWWRSARPTWPPPTRRWPSGPRPSPSSTTMRPAATSRWTPSRASPRSTRRRWTCWRGRARRCWACRWAS